MLRFGLSFVLLFGLGIAAWWLWRDDHASVIATPASPALAVPVTAVTARTADLDQIIAGIGTVAALQTVTVRAQVDGQVTKIGFNEGDDIKADAELVELDGRQLQANLDGAIAKRAQDESQLTSARADAERYQTLADKAVIAQSLLDQKLSTVKQYEAAVRSDDAAVSNAKTQLSFATVRAPISGRTGFRQVEVGAITGPSSQTGIVTITQLDPISVVFVAPGDRFNEIREAMKADVATVEAFSTDGSRSLAKGKLTLMDNQVDQQNGSIRLKATFDNKSGALWPGLPVATRLTIKVERGVVVPDKALARGRGGLYAYVVGSDGKAHIAAVRTRYVTDAQALVESGLKDKDRVVMDGQSRLGDGMTVTSTEWKGDASGALPGQTDVE